MDKQNLLSVVVADDEQELLGAVCQLIDWEGIGFKLVGRASNGLDALQLVEELQPDFLLTDIHMPFISGTALAAQVKAVQPLIQVAFLSGYDEFEYAQQGIASEVIAYLLKPISMAQLTQELIEIHRKIEKKQADFSAARQDASNHQAVAAAMLLDCYFYAGREENLKALSRMGLAPESIRSVTVAALSCADADAQACQTALGAAEKFLSRQYPCRGFCSAGRIVLLLTSENGFLQLHAAIDKLRRALKRLLDLDVSAGISKEHAPDADFHEAYKEAMEALKTAETESGFCAADGQSGIDQLCGRVLQIIDKEYMDETLTLQSVSDRLHVSASYLGPNIKKNAGDTFINLLIRKRMAVALNLLQSSDSRIAEIARRCGYSDQSYFGYCFKKFYGVSPAKMRQEREQKGARA
ncbi:MAG: response regulator [Firmicutes bacterium]|nr:response regulator [Bacillota bacterium]